MNPHIATVIYGVLIAAFIYADRDRNRTSYALWLPTLWLSICASRMLSQWLGAGSQSNSPDQYLEGSPLDRAFLTGLLVLGLGVLIARRQKVLAILRSNLPLVLFVLYCAFSVIWSDFPDVALKRWAKSLGDITMVMIVLTEKNPLSAVKLWLARVGFVLVPVSILLIKYYPDMGRGYNRFTWTTYYTGAATGKNELGIICLISGIVAVWRLVQMWDKGVQPNERKRLWAQLAFLAMVFWLFGLANSMTSLSCFLMASTLIIATKFRFFLRKSWPIPVMMLLMLAVSVSTLFLGMGTDVLKTMGRDPSLTGRTDVWRLVLSIPVNHVIGTGFESFWLGPRLERIWDVYWWHPNEAHSGYIEVFLNLGWIGVGLFALVLISGYRKVLSKVRIAPEEARLRLALLFMATAYNCTESAVRIMHPVWICLLLAVVSVPWSWTAGKSSKGPSVPIPAFQEESLVLAER